MLCVRFAAVMVAVVLAASGPRPCQGQWEALLPELVNKITAPWQNNSLEFLGYPCNYSEQPRMFAWELHINGKFSCPTWTNITGTFCARSVANVRSKSIENFLNKVRNAQLLTDAKASQWLQNQQ